MLIDLIGSYSSFADTNIFAYAQDLRVPDKRETAIELLEQVSDAGNLVVSTQVVNEFCAVMSRGKVGSVSSEMDLKALV